jgi:hypothetical protein
MLRHLDKCPARMSLVNQRLPTDTIPLAIFWEFFVFEPTTTTTGRWKAKFLKEVWSGRPGSNRRRPAWEFSYEINIFSFSGKNLARIFRSQDPLLVSSNFN